MALFIETGAFRALRGHTSYSQPQHSACALPVHPAAAQQLGSVSCVVYDQLKQQVARIRADAANLAAGKAVVHEAESAALLGAKLAYEQQLAEARTESAALQARLKESVDRAARLRQLAERCVSAGMEARTSEAHVFLPRCRSCNTALLRTQGQEGAESTDRTYADHAGATSGTGRGTRG